MGDAHHDAAGVEVVVQCAALPQELGAEQETAAAVLDPGAFGEAHGHGGADHHGGTGVHGHDLTDDALHRRGVEIILVGVVVGGGGDQHQVRITVGAVAVGGGGQVQRTVGQVLLYLGVGDRGDAAVDKVRLLGDDVHGCDRVVLGQQDGHGQTDIAGPGDGDTHRDLLMSGGAEMDEVCAGFCAAGAGYPANAGRNPRFFNVFTVP